MVGCAHRWRLGGAALLVLVNAFSFLNAAEAIEGLRHDSHDTLRGQKTSLSSRSLLASHDEAWLLILEHISVKADAPVDSEVLDKLLYAISQAVKVPSATDADDHAGHDDHAAHEDEADHDDHTDHDDHSGHDHDDHDEHEHEEDNDAIHVDSHSESALPDVITSKYLLQEYGDNETLTQQQFQEAALEIIHCMMDDKCSFETPHDDHAGHDHSTDSANDGLKLILLTVILAWAIFGGMLPFAFRHINLDVYSRSLGLMNSFAGGVFLATGFTHLLPHAIEEAAAFKTGRFPMEYFLIMMGFFSILLFERVIFDKRNGCSSVEMACPPNGVTVTKHDEEAGEGESKGVRLWDIRLELISLASVSLHALLAGLTLGMQDEKEGAMLLFWTIFSHKSVVAFSLGAKFMRAGVSIQQFLLLTIVFSLVTPVGGLIGIALKNLSTVMEVTLNCISTGAFVYMGTIDVVLDEMTSPSTEDLSQKRVSKFAAMFVGVLSISLLTMTTGDDHGH